MSSLLIQDEPLLVLPRLASKIGLNEAIFLQQIHYWLKRSKHYYDDRYWVYNSITNWHKQFPFWNERTLKRIVKNLEEFNLLISGNYNKLKFDKTKWYSINYDRLVELEIDNDCDKLSQRKEHIVMMENDNMSQPIPETTQKINSENTTQKDIVEIINYLNSVCNTSYRISTKKTQMLIKSRLQEGFNINEFKEVIKTKAKEWLYTEQAKYLRPETLFGTKFEGYLQQRKMVKSNGFNKGNRYSTKSFEENELPF